MDDVGDCVVMASSWLLPSKVAVVDPGSFVDPTTITGSPCLTSRSHDPSLFLLRRLDLFPFARLLSLLLPLAPSYPSFRLAFPSFSSNPRCFRSLLS